MFQHRKQVRTVAQNPLKINVVLHVTSDLLTYQDSVTLDRFPLPNPELLNYEHGQHEHTTQLVCGRVQIISLKFREGTHFQGKSGQTTANQRKSKKKIMTNS